VSAALAYLTARSVHNRLAHRAAQLRRPRYLIAFGLGLVYVWLVLGSDRPAPLSQTTLLARSAELIGALVLVGVAAWSWTVGSERRALAFSAAEVTFLFPAPLTRRALVHYKLARLQLLILLNVLIWTLLLSRPGGVSGWRRGLALWVLLSTIALHRIGAALVRRSVAEHGTVGLRSGSRAARPPLPLGAAFGRLVRGGGSRVVARTGAARPRAWRTAPTRCGLTDPAPPRPDRPRRNSAGVEESRRSVPAPPRA